MTLLWMDGFDHYGTGATGNANMLAGTYGEANVATPEAAQSRTGGNSLQIYRHQAGFTWAIRRNLGDAYETVGVGFALYLTTIKAANDVIQFCFLNGASGGQLAVSSTATGAVTVYRGATLLAQSADGALVASAWQHVEIKARIHSTLGAVEVRVNGVSVISISGVNTQATAEFGARQFGILRGGIQFDYFYIDDLYVWNDQGTYNNDFIGDKRVLTVVPDDNTAQADWTPVGAASGYATVDEIPQDGDATYIETQEVGATSEFSIADLVGDYGAISAVMVQSMQRKTVAGVCNVQVSLLSAASEASGADRPITEAHTYYCDVFEEDPNTAAPWTKASVNAAKLKIERTA